jgi:ABC-2 type transport system permease protein
MVFVDPYSVVDRPSRMEMQMTQTMPSSSSDLNMLLAGWGVEMPEKTFAGDRSLALDAALNQDSRPQKIIGFLQLTRDCMNSDSVITANLNQVRVLFAGVLKPTFQDPNDAVHHVRLTQLIQTTDHGNAWKGDQVEMMLQYAPSELNKQFSDGTKPVAMGYLLHGRFKSNFPNGIDVPVDANKPDEQGNAAQTKPTTKHIAGLADATTEGTVVVFSDVDFISDIIAYQKSFFGTSVVGDNAAMLMNTVEDLTGSTDLIAMRSRGSFQRPFVVVDKIEQEAEKQTAQEEAAINAEIAGFQQELQKIVSSAKEGEENLIEKSIVEKKKEIESKIRDAQRKLRNVKMKRREKIEQLGDTLRNRNTWLMPAAVLVVAIVLGIRRSVRRRHYISHASDS